MAMQHHLSDLTAEEAAEKARSIRTKFKQQLFVGVGGAMVFGLTGGIAAKLLTMLGTGFSLAPIVGLAAIAAVGLGCLYLGSKFLAEAVAIDQTAQARKIHEAATGKEREIPALESAISRPTATIPDIDAEQSAALAHAAITSTSISTNGAQWMDTLEPANDRSVAPATTARAAGNQGKWTANLADEPQSQTVQGRA